MSSTAALAPITSSDSAMHCTLFDAVISPDVTNFTVGAPAPALLPVDSTKKAMAAMDSSWQLQYGPEVGPSPFLHALANFLSAQYQTPVDSNLLMVTSGCSQSLSNLLTQFTDMSTVVYMEDPSYFLAQNIVRDHGLRMLPVATDEFGLDMDSFEKQLAERERDTSGPFDSKTMPYPSVLYLVPTYNNPRGSTLPDDRRRRLVDLAYKHSILVVCDDVYDMLTYDGLNGFSNVTSSGPVRRIFYYDPHPDDGRIVSNGTFSKIYAPGVRLGWIEAGKTIIERIKKSGLAVSGGCANQLTSGWMLQAIKMNLLDEQLQRLRSTYSRNMSAMISTLKSELPNSVKVMEPPSHGGFFVWLQLPKHIPSMELRQRAIDEEKISFAAGEWSSPTKRYRNCLRLAVTFYDEKTIVEGVHRLARLLKRVC
ncbi:pyridoxal phosphate-dependent transferase [Gaertneriomyces semiglobifer]|nr:pyridoxal phosphate-dependent transferase [Gaertneriomyces semiglobifer]